LKKEELIEKMKVYWKKESLLKKEEFIEKMKVY